VQQSLSDSQTNHTEPNEHEASQQIWQHFEGQDQDFMKISLICHARLVSLPKQCHNPFAVSWLVDICCCDWIPLFDKL